MELFRCDYCGVELPGRGRLTHEEGLRFTDKVDQVCDTCYERISTVITKCREEQKHIRDLAVAELIKGMPPVEVA